MDAVVVEDDDGNDPKAFQIGTDPWRRYGDRWRGVGLRNEVRPLLVDRPLRYSRDLTCASVIPPSAATFNGGPSLLSPFCSC